MTHAATLESIRDARARIAGQVHETPVVRCSAIDRVTGHELHFKCENFQKVGAFKIRGATNAILRLGDDEARHGVVTHSSGNHAQAVALAARRRAIAAHIVMPTSAPEVKRAAVAEYGATIHPCAPTLEARETTAADLIERTGGTLIPPYDHPDVISGQGTVALELLEQVEDLDVLVVPISGGGLISGVAVAARALRPRVTIIAAEPSGADDAARSKASGERVFEPHPKSIADGLLASLGELTWPIVRDLVDRVITVDDDEIVAAMRLLWERAKLVVEPSGAVGLAVAMTKELDFVRGKRIGVVLSGGNVDLTKLPF